MNKSALLIILTIVLYITVGPVVSSTMKLPFPKISKKIVWSKNLYLLDGSRPLSTSSVDKLVSLCTQKPIAGWHFPKSKVNWLHLNAEKALSEHLALENLSLWPGQRDSFINSFKKFHCNPREIYFYGLIDNSSKHIFLEVSTKDNVCIRIVSRNRFPVLIPWNIRIGSKSFTTYSPDITNAVMAFYPKSSLPQLDASRAFRRAIAKSITETGNDNEWKELEAKGRFPDLQNALLKHFLVRGLEIERSISYESGMQSEYFLAYLKHKLLPENIKIILKAEVKTDLEKVVKHFIDTTENVVPFLKSHKSIFRFLSYGNRTLYLSYTDNGYFGLRDLHRLSSDHIHKFKNTNQMSLSKKWSGSIVLNFTWKIDDEPASSKWLLKPNGMCLLWRATTNCRFLRPGFCLCPYTKTEAIVLDRYSLDELEPQKTWFGIDK